MRRPVRKRSAAELRSAITATCMVAEPAFVPQVRVGGASELHNGPFWRLGPGPVSPERGFGIDSG